jgi:hypothetical protein
VDLALYIEEQPRTKQLVISISFITIVSRIPFIIASHPNSDVASLPALLLQPTPNQNQDLAASFEIVLARAADWGKPQLKDFGGRNQHRKS